MMARDGRGQDEEEDAPNWDTPAAAQQQLLDLQSVVPIVCNGAKGIFLVRSQTVLCGCTLCTQKGMALENPITPTEFERHAGLGTAKKVCIGLGGNS